MTDVKTAEFAVVDGLEAYLTARYGHRVAGTLANTTEHIPPYPYFAYTITTPADGNAKGWCRGSDGSLYRQLTQVWSITFCSDRNDAADEIAQYAFEWFDALGTTYLSDHGYAVERILNFGNRDNLVTIEYEYRRGFDIRLSYMHVIPAAIAGEGAELIETANTTGVIKH